MTTNKERIERMEVELGEMQDKMQRMEVGINDKLAHIEETLSKLAESFNTSKDAPSTNNNIATSRPNCEDKDEDQKVVLASFHLEGEANQWWQWLRRSYQEEGRVVTWEIFMEELWARFGPTDCEDFDEALSRVEQTDSLREYQKEFERLGNRVHGWSQKALVGTFMGGLKPEIAEDIRMFRPRTLKEAISLARMKDDQITRQRRLFQPPSNRAQPTLPPTQASPTVPVKRLPWDEMQRRRAQGLCFTCNERFTAGHKCQGPQLLLLESYNDTNEITCEEVAEELHGEDNKGEQPGKTRHCYSNNFHT
ncbi:hypothetical protein KPL70_026388 [Citrus sinensis]|nr:hypothetical protein KPL70_026387 [Citrus sinensis]KAH9650429.1 hypothetical protein KPL70_026388 [Citrus sinensis]